MSARSARGAPRTPSKSSSIPQPDFSSPASGVLDEKKAAVVTAAMNTLLKALSESGQTALELYRKINWKDEEQIGWKPLRTGLKRLGLNLAVEETQWLIEVWSKDDDQLSAAEFLRVLKRKGKTSVGTVELRPGYPLKSQKKFSPGSAAAPAQAPAPATPAPANEAPEPEASATGSIKRTASTSEMRRAGIMQALIKKEKQRQKIKASATLRPKNNAGDEIPGAVTKCNEAAAYRKQKSYESAISAYGLAIAGATEADMKHTDAAEILLRRGDCYAAISEEVQAIGDFEEAIKIAGSETGLVNKIRLSMARALVQLGRISEAKAQITACQGGVVRPEALTPTKSSLRSTSSATPSESDLPMVLLSTESESPYEDPSPSEDPRTAAAVTLQAAERSRQARWEFHEKWAASKNAESVDDGLTRITPAMRYRCTQASIVRKGSSKDSEHIGTLGEGDIVYGLVSCVLEDGTVRMGFSYVSEFVTRVDLNSNGIMDIDEIAQLCDDVGYPLDDAQLQVVMSELDTDNSGSVEIEEFHEYVTKTFYSDMEGGGLSEVIRRANESGEVWKTAWATRVSSPQRLPQTSFFVEDTLDGSAAQAEILKHTDADNISRQQLVRTYKREQETAKAPTRRLAKHDSTASMMSDVSHTTESGFAELRVCHGRLTEVMIEEGEHDLSTLRDDYNMGVDEISRDTSDLHMRVEAQVLAARTAALRKKTDALRTRMAQKHAQSSVPKHDEVEAQEKSEPAQGPRAESPITVLLSEKRLDQYAGAFVEEEYADIALFCNMSDDEVTQLISDVKMKKAHAIRFRSLVAALQSRTADGTLAVEHARLASVERASRISARRLEKKPDSPRALVSPVDDESLAEFEDAEREAQEQADADARHDRALEWFNNADDDNSGWLADDELEGALDAAGLELTAAETDEILQKVNITREEEDFTSFDEFLAIVKFMHDQ